MTDHTQGAAAPLVPCPRCGGRKGGYGFVTGEDGCGVGWNPCATCKGWGEVEPQLVERIEEGRRRRSDRVARGLTPRQEAERLGIGALEVYALESPQSARDWAPEPEEEVQGG